MAIIETLDKSTINYLETLATVEGLAEEILTCKQQVIDFDRRRNSNREALGVFRRKELPEGKAWVNIGSLFVKLPAENAKKLIEKDQQNLDIEIEDLREQIKEKTAEMNAIEDKRNVYGGPTRGFNLKSMGKEDMSMLRERR